MAEYDTIEYWADEIKAKELDKEIYLNALANVSRKETQNLTLIDLIAERLNDTNVTLSYYRSRMKEAVVKQEMGVQVGN